MRRMENEKEFINDFEKVIIDNVKVVHLQSS